MKKRLFLGMIYCFLILGFTVGCNNNPLVNNNDGDSLTINNNNTVSNWGLQIYGKSISLPCKLSDLEKANIKISDYDKEEILNSSNEKFFMVAGSDGKNGAVFLKILTGNNPNKKEDNATVTIITNNDTMDSNSFKLKNGISIGSSIDDVINTFGNDYVIDSTVPDDLHNGFLMTHYGDEENGLLVWYRDGIVIYIEVFAE